MLHIIDAQVHKSFMIKYFIKFIKPNYFLIKFITVSCMLHKFNKLQSNPVRKNSLRQSSFSVKKEAISDCFVTL
jgi:hypothetical protein